MPPRETFGERVFAARNYLESQRRQRVTLAEFGALVGTAGKTDSFSASSAQRWEQGSVPGIPVIAAIAKACGVDPGWLAFGADCAAPMVAEGRSARGITGTLTGIPASRDGPPGAVKKAARKRDAG